MQPYKLYRMNDDFDSIIDDLTKINDISSTEGKCGKNKRSTIVAYGYHFDSNEELETYEWITEAKELGFVSSFEYQPESFVLYNGFKNDKGKLIVRPHVYTADFKVEFTDKWVEFRKRNKIKFFDKFDEKIVYIDCKGTFNKFGGDERYLSVNVKWCLEKFNVYIWKLIPIKFFEKTWLPKNCVLTKKTKKVSKKYEKLLTFEHKFKSQQNPK